METVRLVEAPLLDALSRSNSVIATVAALTRRVGEPIHTPFAHSQVEVDMAHRLVAILALLTAAPAAAQHREIEAGAGIWLGNPARIEDFVVKSTPSISAAWTNWYDERKGWAAGVVAVPHYDDRETVYVGHVTWRRRWIRDDGSFNHLGFGAGLWTWHYRRPAEAAPFRSLAFMPYWHVEALATRRIRDGLSLRAGLTVTPLLHIPLVVQPTAMLVWSGRELSPAVDVWRMQEPVVTPEQEPDERQTSRTRHNAIVAGIAVGGAGCLMGMGAVATGSEEISLGGICALSAMFLGGIATGTVLLVDWYSNQ